jgi:hypothetical protein
MLVRCLYASRAAKSDSLDAVASILAQSRKNNAILGVTGLLCIAADTYVQVLEGGRDEVGDLYNTIARDERHHHVRLLSFGEIAQRQFQQWNMGKVEPAGLNAAVLLKYYSRAEISPFDAPAEATLALLHELVEMGATASRERG